MKSKKRWRPIGERVHEWLSEPEGETFSYGKWRFWFVAVASLQLINAVLTALIFESAGNLQNYMGAILLGVGALVGWLALGALHYSDAIDRKLARGVSALDSVTLLFVMAHFAFLMWTYGHLKTIQSAEAKYETAAATYNAKAEKLSGDNTKVAEAIVKISENERQRAKIENDTAYQTRKAFEAGARAPKQTASASASAALSPALSAAKVELEKPEKPEKSSAKFLMEWDAWIRAANFGELLLCALTLIFIRNRSAGQNTPRPRVYRSPIAEPAEDFPTELDEAEAENRASSRGENFTKKKETAKNHASSVSEVIAFDPEGLKRLRQTLKDISFRLPGFSFKSYVRGDAVWIMLMKANKGTQQTVSSAKATLEILNDAMTMTPEKFQACVEHFLRQREFKI